MKNILLMTVISAILTIGIKANATTYSGTLTTASNISQLKPGDTLLVTDKIITSKVIIWEVHGTSQNPITIKSSPSISSQTDIENSVVFSNADNIIFDGFKIHNSPYSGVIIQQGANAITVQNSQIYNNPIGVWIGNGAGMMQHILNNSIHNNKIHGVAIDLIDNVPGYETLIQGNQIYQNGSHGIEINGNYYIINKNTVWGNGLTVPGSSGIHTYTKNATQGRGQHNIITYNISYQNKDNTTDGNGIQLDQWCDNNLVAFNRVYQNDGAGIILYDAAHNTVHHNTLYDNMVDPAHSHPFKGQLVLATDPFHKVKHTMNNDLYNNLIYKTKSGVVPIYVDLFTLANHNVINDPDPR